MGGQAKPLQKGESIGGDNKKNDHVRDHSITKIMKQVKIYQRYEPQGKPWTQDSVASHGVFTGRLVPGGDKDTTV